MKEIFYFITDVGWGHLTRSIAVLEKLLSTVPEVKITVKLGRDLTQVPSLFPDTDRITLKNLPFKLVPGWPATYPFPVEVLQDMIADWLSQWENMVEHLRKEINKASLVLTDASPLPIEAAFREGVPSVFISNFNFYDEYSHIVREPSLEKMKKAYEKVSWAFLLPLESENTVFKIVDRAPLIAREHNPLKVQEIRRDLRTRYRPEMIAVISMGGFYSIPEILIESIVEASKKAKILWLVPEGIELPKGILAHQYRKYEDFRNLLAASDFVIAKYGYGIASEAVVSRVPMVLFYRSAILEDSIASEELVLSGSALRFPWEACCSIPLEEVFYLDFSNLSKRMENKGAAYIVEKIIKRFL
ncbi:conserved hypothetical protein [Thermosulfidibacter takaii ABI70S6]|uniref:Glycosyl transferase family 28 C-terminal domain-containing protein n=1 Tax=Thermosulfidibacter takaii (strain DSM 17441 / JCM 13301 / NBRC 103674 / ABI70S6) TaxID=1298851 RepID=A0A0S3QVR2_THET7|nr:hypothetical protein [Thermosulfidibacter takaii]BAT72408.1 conserved hypothetical protein [Thermosulfidibacter takaii ABI70S6]